MRSPTAFILAQFRITQLTEKRTKVHAVGFTQRHLLRGTLQMSLENYLTIEIDYEVAHWLVKQVVRMLNIMLVDGNVVCNEDRERVTRPATRSSGLLTLARGC